MHQDTSEGYAAKLERDELAMAGLLIGLKRMATTSVALLKACDPYGSTFLVGRNRCKFSDYRVRGRAVYDANTGVMVCSGRDHFASRYLIWTPKGPGALLRWFWRELERWPWDPTGPVSLGMAVEQCLTYYEEHPLPTWPEKGYTAAMALTRLADAGIIYTCPHDGPPVAWIAPNPALEKLCTPKALKIRQAAGLAPMLGTAAQPARVSRWLKPRRDMSRPAETPAYKHALKRLSCLCVMPSTTAHRAAPLHVNRVRWHTRESAAEALRSFDTGDLTDVDPAVARATLMLVLDVTQEAVTDAMRNSCVSLDYMAKACWSRSDWSGVHLGYQLGSTPSRHRLQWADWAGSEAPGLGDGSTWQEPVGGSLIPADPGDMVGKLGLACAEDLYRLQELRDQVILPRWSLAADARKWAADTRAWPVPWPCSPWGEDAPETKDEVHLKLLERAAEAESCPQSDTLDEILQPDWRARAAQELRGLALELTGAECSRHLAGARQRCSCTAVVWALQHLPKRNWMVKSLCKAIYATVAEGALPGRKNPLMPLCGPTALAAAMRVEPALAHVLYCLDYDWQEQAEGYCMLEDMVNGAQKLRMMTA